MEINSSSGTWCSNVAIFVLSNRQKHREQRVWTDNIQNFSKIPGDDKDTIHPGYQVLWRPILTHYCCSQLLSFLSFFIFITIYRIVNIVFTLNIKTIIKYIAYYLCSCIKSIFSRIFKIRSLVIYSKH